MKHLQYLKYIIIHKWYTLIECIKLGIMLRGIFHDTSKFYPSEWFAYTNYFHDKDKSSYWGFRKAWLKHLNHNDHHWQHWTNVDSHRKTIPHEMDKNAVKEMLADWRAMGRARRNKACCAAWYKDNCQKMILHKRTLQLLHSLMTTAEKDAYAADGVN